MESCPEITIMLEPFDIEGGIGRFINFSAIAEANKPSYQWFDKNGEPIQRRCQSNLTIGPIKEEDFGFYQLKIKDELTKQTVITRWTELKRETPKEHIKYNYLYQRSSVQNQASKFSDKKIYYQQQLRLQQEQQEQLIPKLRIEPEGGGAYLLRSKIELIAHFENATHYRWFNRNTLFMEWHHRLL